MTKAVAVMVCGGEKKLLLRVLNFDVWQGGRLSGRPFCSRRIPRVRFLSEQSQIRSTNKNVVILYVYLHMGTTKSCFSAKKEHE